MTGFIQKTFIGLIIFFVLFITLPKVSYAGEDVGDYTIQSFKSEITIEKNTDILINETIAVNFPEPKHGIFRIIPTTYFAAGKTIRTRVKVESVVDNEGEPFPFTISRLGKSVSIKIGDPNATLSGLNTFVITYRVSKVLQRFDDHDELYWNVTGHEWDTDILNAGVRVSSPYARITKVECFAGSFGGSDRFCKSDRGDNYANFISTTDLGQNKDFTIVLGLDKNNNLLFPSPLVNWLGIFLDNWPYVPSVAPLIIMFSLWYKKGRDRRYLSDNIYYTPEDTREREVRPFEKNNIPFVYHPIEGFSPSVVGTVVDEKVDIADVVAEITELARLGYLEIRKIEKKKLIGSEVNFTFIKTDKTDDDEEKNKLQDYQKYLLNEVFRSSAIHRSVKEAEDLFRGKNKELDEARKLLARREYVLLSGLKNHFYEGLPVFKQKLYERMKVDGLFSDNPDGARIKWVGFFLVVDILFAIPLFSFYEGSGNFGPIVALVFFSIPAFAFALAMPRRTAKGYSFFRQIQGLKWYLSKGKWRQEQAEKNLFIESVLPLAISLGVVEQLTRDMKDLNVAPPAYFAGSNASLFANDFSTFKITTTSSFLSAPQGKWSGSSSWSGGSGYSGGSSGGGFGGGGGGSW